MYLWVGVWLIFCVTNGIAQDLNVIYKKHIESLGGAEKIQKVATVTMFGMSFNEWNRSNTKSITYRSLPNLSRHEDIKGEDTTFACFDGHHNCIGSKPERSAITRIAQMQKENAKTVKPSEGLVSRLILFEGQKGNVIPVKTDSCVVYEITFEDDVQKDIFYIDSNHFFIQKHTFIQRHLVSGKLVSYSSTHVYSDYKAIEGIYFPTKVISWLETDERPFLRTTTKYIDIKLNDPLDPALFRCP